MIQINVANILIFLNLRLLQQNHQYSTKGGFYNLVKIIVTINDKMVIDLVLTMIKSNVFITLRNEILNDYNKFKAKTKEEIFLGGCYSTLGTSNLATIYKVHLDILINYFKTYLS
jgi:hypothetical protein